MPESLRFLRDSMVATALSMVLMYVVIALIFLAREGEAAYVAFEGGAENPGNFLMQALTQGLQFGIAVAVILFGVRTILAEIVPAFQGIAARIVPGAKPALDAPIVFPYAQNAVLIGFLFSFTGGLIGLAVLSLWLNPAFGLALILPGLVPHFFTGGAAGVYGNATGGRRGAMAGGFVNGLLITFLPAVLLLVLGDFGAASTTFGDTDFGWFGILIGFGAGIGSVGGLIVVGLLGLLILLAAILVQRRVVDRGWDPSPHRAKAAGATEEAAVGAGGPSAGSATGTASKYPKITPPRGAPPPPPRPRS